MTGELKSAFDGIRAEDSLKSNTMQFLYDEIQKRGKSKRRTALRKYTVALGCVVILLLSGTFTYTIYITPAAYVDVDVNPSIELTLNKFDRVIDARAYNLDGVSILDDILLKHKSYGDALVVLMDTIVGHGYLSMGGLVSVTLQTDDKSRENELLTNIQNGVEDYITSHHHTAQIDVFLIGGDIRNESYKQGLSPAKYLAILELMEVDPAASLENCHGHSISEIKQMTKTHDSNHHSVGDADVTVEDPMGKDNFHHTGGHQGSNHH